MSFGEAIRKSMDTDLLDNRDENADNAVKKGRYTVVIDDAGAWTSRKGDDYAKVVVTILEGPVEGRFEHFMGFGSAVQEQINGNALAVYGVDWTKVDSITDLDLQMGQLKGTKAELTAAWNNGFLNINVHRSWPPEPKSDIPTNGKGESASGSFAAAAGAKDDDPTIPF